MIVALPALLLASSLPQDPELPELPELPGAERLLDALDARNGTAEARAAARCVVLHGRIELPGIAGATFLERHALDPARPGEHERVLVEHAVGSWGTTTQGTDGAVSWTTDPSFGVLVKEDAAQGPARRMWAIPRSAPWRSLYESARTRGTAELDGRACWEIEMQPAGGPAETWLLDRSTGDLVAYSLGLPSPTGGTFPSTFLYDDWRVVDGIRYPFLRVHRVGFQGQDAEPATEIRYVVSSVEHPGELEPAALAPPEDVALAIADPARRTPAPPEDDPEVCALHTVEARDTASVRAVVDANEVTKNLAQMLTEVMGAIGEQGVQPTGPPFSRYHEIDQEAGTIDLEAGLPVAAPVEAAGRVRPSTLPGGRMARTWHAGSYHDLPRSYARLERWMQAEGLEPAGGFWEVYWTDPGVLPDPKDWRTEILWPLE